MPKQAEVPLEDAIEIANEHMRRGNYIVAERAYRDILNAVPDHYESTHFLGLACYYRGNLPEAVRMLERASQMEEAGEDVDCWNNLAIFLSEAGRKEEALEAWSKALKGNPDFADTHSNMANTLWELKRYEEAEGHCRKALELKPDYPDALLNLGNALVEQGNRKEAMECWEKAVEIEPNYAKAWSNLGNALREEGRLAESEEKCRKTLELDPNNYNVMSNLGNVLRDLGKSEEAEEWYRKATSLKPSFVQAHNNLAVALMDQGRYEEAIVSARYAVSFDQEYGEGYSNLSVCLREMGQMPEAEVAAQKALALLPEEPNAYIDLADILFMVDRFDEAEALLQTAQEMKPDAPRILLKLAGVLERVNRVEEALEFVDKAAELNPEMPEVYYRKALIYYMINKPEKALEQLDKVIGMRPNYLPAWQTMSEIKQSLGEMDEALKIVRRILKQDDTLAGCYTTIAKTKKFTEDDPDFIKMKELAENIDRQSVHQASALHFALFSAYENIGDYKKAFEHLKQGNDLKRTSIPYNQGNTHAYYDQMKEIYTKEHIDSFKDKGCDSDIPVFIVGMPRSGTTLTEQIISSHPDVFGAGELSDTVIVDNEFGNVAKLENARAKGEAYVEGIKKHDTTGKALRITDKMPGNFSKIGELLCMLPNAKIVHCRRNPIDTCLSCYKQSFARGQYWSYNLEEMAQQYQLYLDIMEYWRKTVPDRFLEINYEETVDNLEEQARMLIDYVGLPWDDACLEPHKQKRSVMTASKLQVIKPIYKTSVQAWRRYEEQLQPLVEILAPEEALKNKKKKSTKSKSGSTAKKAATRKPVAKKKS